ncbi:STAS domain-containing protein (plasmid) [Streptomyces sp. BH-SS-21]|uniref:STAS domain-containing protein n=1 Tax=Streptomyces liliiviolaceus TaxID=2823109 RepID=A0A940Y9R5_9ACTN|nr:STAS domain-containing protein [Streptomyces liliiviolaceus]MBQ0855667.1 STAS domain-containing protein [Streptomyces liliiviolaceus]
MGSDQTRPNGGRLRVSSASVGDCVTVSVEGAVDHLSSFQLAGALTSALTGDVQWIKVDLQQVEFCDCSGLNVLLGARERALEAGAGFRVTEPVSAVVARLFDMTGTGSLLLGQTAA